MKKLINDNVPKILKINRVEKCSDDKEFYQLLRHKIVQNVNKIFDTDILLEKDKKINALLDSLYDLNILADKFKNIESLMARRQVEIGGYDNRYYVEIGDKTEFTGEEIDRVKKYGQVNSYPSMVLRRHNSKITKSLGAGKDKWEEAISWSELGKPYSENFIDLLKAVEENDIIETE